VYINTLSMSDNQRSEINISKQNIYGKCDSKCIFNFHYETSNLTAKNNGINISLTPDDTNYSPVTYNESQYNVQKIDLFCPSLHLFDGKKLNAEIVITHVPELGGPQLLVCIPIAPSGDSTNATNLLTEIINDVASGAPKKGETTTLSISNFNLQEIVPKKPFISYSGAFSQTTSNYIVFGKVGVIPLSQDTLDTLGKIIKPFPLQMYGGNLFINEKGPNTQLNSKGIYISCKPTGSSTDEENITTSSSSSSSSSNIFNNPIFIEVMKFLFIFIIFIILFMGMNYAFTSLTSLSSGPPKSAKNG